MKKADYISVLITFVVGIYAGGYLYLTVFAPAAQSLEPDQEKVLQLSITGELYGGCRSACQSFHVLGDASFRYFYTLEGSAKQKKHEGKLSRGMQQRIDSSFITEELERQSKLVEKSDCSSYSDGIDVTYEIVYQNEEYLIDSCTTAADGESELWKTLSDIWQDMASQ
ncbi:MAG: hypothetical protein LR008_00720 [Candidatus Pacebacteria bacterium]|nr:hypothetical protein [Candidatus Paceibacterota bacterium]